MSEYDVIIVGGGVVGTTLAVALGESDLRLALIERQAQSIRVADNFDTRTIGLAASSVRFLDSLDIWASCQSFASPIEKIHISDKGHFGFTRLEAKQFDEEAFGYVVSMPHIIRALQSKLHEQQREVICPATVKSISPDQDGIQVTLEDGTHHRCQLLVAADGTHSQIRNLHGINAKQHDYGQVAIIASAKFSKSNQGTAYERFTATGPLAVLPLPEQKSGLVWTVPADRSEAYCALSEPAFCAEVQHQFGYRLGKLEQIGKRFAYPLVSCVSEKKVARRTVIIGNAANTIHPIGAQGLNLGLRDVRELVRLIQQYRTKDIGAGYVLAQYETNRAADHRTVVTGSDVMVRLFSSDFLPFVIPRNIGLMACDILPFLKTKIARRAMGEV